MRPYMIPDAYGRTTIRNIYFDTDTYLLIRRSVEKPVYKEKLRIRRYAKAEPDSPVVFIIAAHFGEGEFLLKLLQQRIRQDPPDLNLFNGRLSHQQPFTHIPRIHGKQIGGAGFDP